MTFFLKISVFMSADLLDLFNFKPDMLFFLKIPYLLRMLNRKVHADLSVPQSHYKGGTPTQSVKISTLDHNFLIHY